MTMMVSIDYNPVIEAVYAVIKNRQVLNSGRVTDKARAEGESMGFEKAMSQILAALGTLERVKLMGPLLKNESRQYVTAVDTYRVAIWLRDLKGRWDSGQWTDQSDDALNRAILGEYNDLWCNGEDEWFTKQYEPTRRNAVKAGIVEPEDGDAAWIKEELDLFQAMANPLQALMDKVNK